MKFERVDDKTVRCFISNEELEGYQIDYKDFVLRSEKAREVVRDIITQASEEVGYKPPKFAFDMSIMMMPDQGLLLTFSESDPLMDKDNGRLMEYLKEKEIGTLIHYPVPPHLQQAYEYLGHKKGDLPICERYANEVLSIPMYNGITEEEQERVIRALNEF